MLQLRNVSLSFGGQQVFRGLDWQVRKGDRTGLVGPNGAGKTTLFRLLIGRQEPDAGQVQRARGLRVGYLPQEGIEVSGRDVFAETRAALPELPALQAELATLEAGLREETDGPEAQAELLARYGEVQYRIEALDGFRADAAVATVLNGLGFREAQFTTRTDTLSGGWQARIALAKLLLQRPDVLLLDEPTNHLDLDSLLWLESYLRGFPGSLVIVSHDRAFLDRMVNRVAALHDAGLTEYVGGYAAFERVFEERLEAQRKAYAAQQDEIERMTRFINTFRYNARKASQVQSRVKQLEKMARLAPPQATPKGVRFTFPAAPRSGRRMLELGGAAKRYGALRVFEGIDLVIERGDRVALVGVNGAGKSTLSRILAGVEAPSAGSRRVGHQVVLDYYAQQQAERLDGRNTVYDEVAREAATDVVPQLRTLLGAFLFSGDTVDKPVRVLSGGEKSRLALAKMLLQASNLLILDEPTNHLDIRTKDVLKQALLQYAGAYLVVSHDRDFLSGLVTKVMELRDGACHVYPGTFDEFLERKARETAQAGQIAQGNGAATDRAGTSTAPVAEAGDPAVEGTLAAIRHADRFKKKGKRVYQQHKAARAARQRRAKRVAAAERRITALEDEIRELERTLTSQETFSDAERAREVTARHERLRRQLDEQYTVWTELAGETTGESA